jgi:glycosyltransferase involved in cell wall biosynthesis
MSRPSSSWELVVVDNNSRDATRSVVEDFGRTSGVETRYVFESRQGLSHARNAGVKAVRGDIVAFTDDDVTVDVHWLQRLQEVFDQTDCLGVAGRILPTWSCPKPRWLEEDARYPLMAGVIMTFDLGDQRGDLASPPFGANMSFRRSAFERYGLFRTDLGRVGAQLLGSEDTEFGRRLLGGDEKLVYEPGAIIYHPVDPARVTKRYFRSWYYSYGRSLVRANGGPHSSRNVCGVPLFLVRKLAANAWAITRASGPRGHLYTQVQMCMTVGQIVEVYRKSHERRLARADRA